jgi:hypothetical protein
VYGYQARSRAHRSGLGRGAVDDAPAASPGVSPCRDSAVAVLGMLTSAGSMPLPTSQQVPTTLARRSPRLHSVLCLTSSVDSSGNGAHSSSKVQRTTGAQAVPRSYVISRPLPPYQAW